MKSLDNNFKVIKTLNNNVLFVTQNNKEKILFKKGIGFGKKVGDTLPVDKKFSIENESNSNSFKKIISAVDGNIVGLCEEIISMIANELNENLNEKIHISLIDHISYKIKRLKTNDVIQNPFLIETETLYKKEFEIAKKAAKMLEEKINIKIPESEIGFITLHIHSARNKGKLSNTIKYAFLSNAVVDLVEKELGIKIDRHSLDYARFVTHIRFAVERIINNIPIKSELLNEIKDKYPDSYRISNKVSKLIQRELYKDVDEDETAFLTIHIERIKNNER